MTTERKLQDKLAERIEEARQALQYNRDNGLYQGDGDHLRVYATFKGGDYDGQRTSIKSLVMLERYEAAGQQFADIEVISTNDAWRDYFDSMKAA